MKGGKYLATSLESGTHKKGKSKTRHVVLLASKDLLVLWPLGN